MIFTLDFIFCKQGRDSHFIYTIHVYQHSVATQSAGQPNANVLLGGRSRLHLIDFGCCERTKTIGGSITQAGLGNVILGILNGQRHLPFKESKVTQLLREVLGSVSCQAALLAHISPEPSHYSETLHTIQLASRIHRMRRKKMKVGGSSGGGSGSGSSDENRRLGKLQKAGFPPPHDSGRNIIVTYLELRNSGVALVAQYSLTDIFVQLNCIVVLRTILGRPISNKSIILA